MCRIILQSAACCVALPFGTLSVALFIQHVNLISMCRIILQSAACCAALPFGTLSYKRHEFREDFLNIKFVFRFCLQFCLKHFPFSEQFSQVLS